MTEGTRSTELWATFAVVALIVFNRQFGLNLNESELYSLAGLGGGYAISRGLAKRK